MRRMSSQLCASLTTSLVLALSLAGCGSINSGLRVEPRKQFVLGGGQAGAFKVEANNVGDVPVRISLRRDGGVTTDLGSLAPGQKETLSFPEGSAAVVANESDNRIARIDLRVTGDTDLGMRYEDPALAR